MSGSCLRPRGTWEPVGARLGVCLSIPAGRSIAGVLENQCEAGGFSLGVENYHMSEGGSIKVGCRVLWVWSYFKGPGVLKLEHTLES